MKPQEDTKRRAPAEFDLWGVEVLLTSASGEEAQTLNYVWRPSGEVPVYPAYHNSLRSFHTFGGSLSTEPELPIAQPYTPTSNEIIPIPRVGENLDAETVPDPPLYSWTQTSDSITVAFPLPTTTPKSAIKVTFTLNLFISNGPQESNPSPTPLSLYLAKAFWDGVQSSTSFRTWEKTGERGLRPLTLHLDK